MAKITITVIFTFAIVAFMYWLWQRQPKIPQVTTPQTTQQVTGEEREQSLQIKPQDGSILTQNKITFEGRAKPNQTILIYSNDFASATKSDKDGNFSQNAKLVDGLNIVQIVYLENDPKQSQKYTLTYLVAAKSDPAKTNVFAGPVKSIFDNVLVITWQGKDKTINALPDADVILPKNPKGEENEATGSATSSIRLRDFVIAGGTLGKNGQLTAKSLEVIRENPPQMLAQFAQIKILNGLNKNSFSARDEITSEIVAYSVDKNTEILQDSQKAQAKNIVKDKKAIIVYHAQNLADFIYLLP